MVDPLTLFAEFLITNGTETVDLLSFSSKTGAHLKQWSPQITDAKGGGIWSDSATSDGSEPLTEALGNVTEDLALDLVAWNDDDLFALAAKLRGLLREARRYWMTGYQANPVWIKRQALCETNPGYALVMAGTCPEENDPFTQPVEIGASNTVAYLDWPMQIIREPLWRDTAPGTTVCQEVAAYDDLPYPCYVEFNATNTLIAIADNAQIRDLHDAAMTAEAWIRADGPGEGNIGCIVQKGWAVANTGWRLYVAANGLTGYIECATQDAFSVSGTDDFTPDSEWHHVAMTWDDATYNYPRLWVDGTEVTYASTQNRNGAVQTDNGQVAGIGNRTGTNVTFNGGIGWVRLSNIVRYNAMFTPPERCVMPNPFDPNTMGQWIGAECSGGTIDNQDGLAAIDGTLTNGTFDCECYESIGQVDPTCEDIAYITNYHLYRRITHIFHYDAGTFSFGPNLVGTAGPITVFPAPAAGDRLWIGIAAGAPYGEEFNNLIWDVASPLQDMSIDVQTGAGVTILDQDCRDNTNSSSPMFPQPLTGTLGNTGINNIVWDQQHDPTLMVVNGINGYWIRYEVAAIGGAPVSPIVNQMPYHCPWPYIEIDADDIGGDEAALVLLRMRNQSEMDNVPPVGQTGRILAGVRSIDRGDDFTAYLNCGDFDEIPGQTNTLGANTAFVASPIGFLICSPRIARYLPIANPEAMADRVIISLDQTISGQFAGQYHAYLRPWMTTWGGASVYVYNFRIGVQNGVRGQVLYNDVAYVTLSNPFGNAFIDLGKVTLGKPGLSYDQIILHLQAGLVSATIGLNGFVEFHDLFLLPVDECSGDFTMITSANFTGGEYVELDSATYPRDQIIALVNNVSDYPTGQMLANATVMQVQPDKDQRIWFSAVNQEGGAFFQKVPQPYIMHTVQMERVRLYRSMRGNQ